jgi:hypothetical protein
VSILLRALAVTLAASAATASIAKADERDDARELVYQGDDLFAERRYADALDAYRKADDIMHVPTTTIEVAKTLAVLGRLREARDVASALVTDGPTIEAPAFAIARERARALVAEIDKKRASLVVKLEPAAEGAVVRVRSEAASYTPAAGEELKLDPGTYTVVVSAPGYVAEQRTVRLVEEERMPIALSLHRSEHVPALGIAGFVVSALGMTTATVTGIGYAVSKPNADENCPAGTCSAASRANALGTTAAVALGVGVASGVAGGVAWWLETKPHASGVESAFVIGPGYAGYAARF